MSLKTELALHNSASMTLTQITRSIDVTITAFSKMKRSFDKGLDLVGAKNLKTQLSFISTEQRKFQNHTQSLYSKISQNANAQGQMNSRLKAGTGHADELMKKVGGIAKKYMSLESVEKLFKLSDQMTENRGKLALVVDDGGSVKELEQKIYASAQRARVGYTDTIGVVSELGTLAGEVFNGSDEIVAFTELLNKNVAIGGNGGEEQKAVTEQFTQAMASGGLQSSNYETLLAQTPVLSQAIEDYMRNVQGAEGSLGDWASQGLITADVIKSAMFNSANETNKRFEAVPRTWGQIWTEVVNHLLIAITPLLEMISFLAQHWELIEPIVVGVATAIGILTVAHFAHSGALNVATLATKIFNSALLNNPLTVVAVVIGAVIALIYRWVQSVGGIRIAWAIAMNQILYFVDMVKLGIYLGVYSIISKFEFLKYNLTKIGYGIMDVFSNIKIGFFKILDSMINGSISGINWLINKLNSLPGVNLKTIEYQSKGAEHALHAEAKRRQKRHEQLENLNSQLEAGRQKREAEINRMRHEAEDNKKIRENAIEIMKKENDLSVSGGSSGAGSEKNATEEEIAKNTGDINDRLGEGLSDLKYMRDMAERDVINRFTTAEIKIEQTNHNNISGSPHDLDGIIDSITQGVAEGIAVSSQGL